ncbi:RNA deprotection pyrophosphohydrolase [Bacillus taeanensis]|uniref:Nucleoside triphosphatase YtkD n=1 Tax=Bacillus taeanensis TaxID=273032 RepID=A0A366XZ03_9BACI|nr:nucleoside triphosphatase YtkD [Bacillus taeanensis]RBW71630.1 nucleoside triphosphatase YtkD [Bacillus taeanensis]
MISFTDYHHNPVHLSFSKMPFSSVPKHVWIICRFNGKWLLTDHPERGLEFPGGKVEEEEAAEQAAVREVFEETGAEVSHITYIGQYMVEGKGATIIKNIYYGKIKAIIPQENYHETNGPVLLEELPNDIRYHDRFSFMMKDDVLVYSLNQIKQYHL